jgi:enamine deaminase RidA (YjgF/YER057c/UK114 family)
LRHPRDHQILLPSSWPRPKGYSNGVAAEGRQGFVAGQVGWNSQGRFTGTSMAEQVKQALLNVLAVLAEARGRPEHIVRLTWYMTSREEYLAQLKEIGAAYRDVMGSNYPAMTAVQVVALMEAEAKVEIEATAVIPDVASA